MATVAAPRTSYAGPFAAEIDPAARAAGIDPFWLASVLGVESRFTPTARNVNRDGSVDRGIGQINSSAHPDVTDAQAYDPRFAIPWVARYLRSLLGSNGSVVAATRAYNTGSGAPSGAGNAYVEQVMAHYRDLKTTAGPVRMATGGPDPYPWLQIAPQADWRHVDSGILARLNAIGQRLGKVITIVSGYRSPAYSQQVGGYANDPHTRGVAVDAYIGSTPIGDYRGALGLIGAAGLESGAQPNFYNGQPDPEHVQIPGSGVNKAIVSTALGGPAGPAPSSSTASAQDASLPWWTHPLFPGGGKGGVPGGVASGIAGGLIGGVEQVALYLLFLGLGFALVLIGIARLFGQSPRDVAGNMAAAGAAGAVAA